MTQVGANALRAGLTRISALMGRDALVTIATTPRGIVLKAHDFDGLLEWYVGGEGSPSGDQSLVTVRLAQRLLRGLTDTCDVTAAKARLTVDGATVRTVEEDPIIVPPAWREALAAPWTHQLDHTMLAKSLAWVAPAIRRDNDRPILSSVAMGYGGFAAADNYRIHLADWPHGVVPFERGWLVLPVRLVDVLRAALVPASGGLVGYARLTVAGVPATAWQVGQHRMIYRDQDGQYPNFQSILPAKDQSANTWEMQAADVVGPIRRAASLAPEGVLRWHDHDMSLAWDDIEFEAKVPGGPEHTTGFRSEYLADALRGAEGPVIFTGHGPLTPLLIEPMAKVGGPTCWAVIMPVRTTS